MRKATVQGSQVASKSYTARKWLEPTLIYLRALFQSSFHYAKHLAGSTQKTEQQITNFFPSIRCKFSHSHGSQYIQFLDVLETNLYPNLNFPSLACHRSKFPTLKVIPLAKKLDFTMLAIFPEVYASDINWEYVKNLNSYASS